MERGGRYWEIGFLLLNVFVYWPDVFAQEGYLSLACGSISSFTDSTTGIYWTADDNYTSTGVTWGIGISSTSGSTYNLLRYFPEGNKNCYNIDVTSGIRYLIRGTHVYLNHDGNNRPPEFDVAVDANIVFSVKTSGAEAQVHEVIVTAKTPYLNYCLLTREGSPVISSLEIRPLPESLYSDASHGSLALVGRVDFGNILRDVRYPHDSLDRIWTKATGVVQGTSVITTREIALRSRVNNGAAPDVVFESARVADSRIQRLEYTWSTRNTKDRFIVFLYFAELNGTKSGDRVFDIAANGMPIGEHDVLQSHPPFSELVVHFSVAGSPTLTLGIEAAMTSRELPFVNAIEIYQFISTVDGAQDSYEDVPSNCGFRLLGRRLLKDSSNSATSSSKDGGDNLWKTLVGAAVGTAAFLILIAIIITAYCYRKRKAVKVPHHSPLFSWTGDTSNGPNYVMKSPLQELKQLEMQYTGPQELSLKEVQTVTEKFKSKIGEGGFGAVYLGTLSTGTAVAVKVRSLNSNQGTKEFTTELDVLRNIKHENLVPLVGFCTENLQQILIYPYMSNGSLYDRLYDKSFGRKPLDWITRLNILLGAARGIHFLHTGGDRCIIHRDVKSSNILLDDSMKAKIADFGLSKLSPKDDESLVSTEVRGTAEYLDPEYYQFHQLTEMSDVYSFGILLLETVCGRKPLDMNRPKEERSLLEWIRPYVKDANIEHIVDPDIEAYTPESLWRVIETALQSVEPFSSRRPTIAYIVRELEDALIIENNASQYMASIQSLDSLCIPQTERKEFSLKEPLSHPMTFPFELSPVFSETMNVAPDPR